MRIQMIGTSVGTCQTITIHYAQGSNKGYIKFLNSVKGAGNSPLDLSPNNINLFHINGIHAITVVWTIENYFSQLVYCPRYKRSNSFSIIS